MQKYCRRKAEEVSFESGHTIGLCQQTQKLELHYMSPYIIDSGRQQLNEFNDRTEQTHGKIGDCENSISCYY